MKREQKHQENRVSRGDCLDFIVEYLVDQGVNREMLFDLYDVLKAAKLLQEYARQHYDALSRQTPGTGWLILEVVQPEVLDEICDRCRAGANDLGELGRDWIHVAEQLVDAWKAYQDGAAMSSVLRVPVIIDRVDAGIGKELYSLYVVGEFGDIRADRGQVVRNVAAFLECVENAWLKHSVYPYEVCRDEFFRRLDEGFVQYGSGSACRVCNSIQG